MPTPQEWLKSNHASLVQDLAKLVAIPSVSNDGEHQKEIGQAAGFTADLMKQAGLAKVEVLTSGKSNPYVYGEWLGAPGKPTVFLYSHHDVQPTNYIERWETDPWVLTPKNGRLFARGSSDDKGGVIAQLGAIAACLKGSGSLPVNVKVLVEGEEEIGSPYLFSFFKEHRDRIKSDVIVVTDTDNLEVGLPSITYSLRGIVSVLVEVETAELPVHSGLGGGALADAALALNVILARLFWGNGPLPIPGYYASVRPLTDAERKTINSLPGDVERWRKDCGVLSGVAVPTEAGCHPYEQTWRKPAATVIAQEASSIKSVSNQVLPRASAIISCRIVPDQDPAEVLARLQAFLGKDPPWGAKVKVTPHGPPVKWWFTDPNGPAFEAALAAMETGFKKKPIAIGSGGSIGFVGPLSDLYDGAPALLFGLGDPTSNPHAPNESLHEGDWHNLMVALSQLFANLGKLTPDKIKR